MVGHIHSIESFGTVDGPGVRMVVFTKGCPMRCLYCHNPDTWEMSGGTDMTSEEILEQFEKNRTFYKTGGITVTGGEPLMQIDFVIDLFEKAKEKNIHTCLDTSGVTFRKDNTEKFDRLVKVTDLVMLDIKVIDPQEHLKLCSQPLDNILDFTKYLEEKEVPVWIRHVVVPNITENEKYLYDLGYYIGGLKNLKALDVLPYHDMGKIKYENLGIDYPLKDTKPLPRERAIEAKKIVLQGIKDRRLEENK
jgi:pyruvate formate lyase activating enzyme